MSKKIIVSIILSICFCLAGACSAQTATVVDSKSLTAAGLKSKVTVRRDNRSIPYIEAGNDADLYFAQGYITASDRLWQMDLLRRLARGETAEIFGSTTLDEDKRWRKFGFSKIAEDSLQYLSPELRTALEDYSRGVNAYIQTLDQKSLPPEFQVLQYQPTAWKPTDTIVIGKILADALSTTWQSDLARLAAQKSLPKEKFNDLTSVVTTYDVVLFGKDSVTAVTRNKNIPADPANKEDQQTNQNELSENSIVSVIKKENEIREKSLALVGLYAEDLAASNNFVISGKLTADGKPILENDPHLQASAPSLWYLSSLSAPGLRVAGVTFPGVPGVVLGHNENIAWGATNVGPDVQDLYLEKFSVAEPDSYQTPNGWEKAVSRKEEIKVRKSPFATATETVNLNVVETRNGVIFTEVDGNKYALKWTARDPKNNEFEAFYYANRARNWDDFKKALKSYGGSTQNFAYADVKGNIGWYAAGRIPIRRTGDGSLPYEGWKNDGDWTGYIPFEELPNLYNPSEGFIVTANQRTAGTDYKYKQFTRDVAMPWRARRIYDSIKAKSKITMDDVRDIQYDITNIPLSNFAKEIVKSQGASLETLAVVKNWDGKMTADSQAALLVNTIRNCVTDVLARDNKGIPASMLRERVLYLMGGPGFEKWRSPAFSDNATLLKSCDNVARVNLAKQYGDDPAKWVWGNYFQSRLPHPLAGAPLIGGQFATPVVPLDGSGQTPNVGSSVSMRLIASPGNWDATRHVIPLGENGDPNSIHFKDQFDSWRIGNPEIFPFSKAAVEKAAKEILVMQPN